MANPMKRLLYELKISDIENHLWDSITLNEAVRFFELFSSDTKNWHDFLNG